MEEDGPDEWVHLDVDPESLGRSMQSSLIARYSEKASPGVCVQASAPSY